jgi:small subunit ribosomal protein S2
LRASASNDILGVMESTQEKEAIEPLFEAGAHMGYSRSRRHPKMKEFIFGFRNAVEIIDLWATEEKIKEAEAFLERLGSEGQMILLVGSKPAATKHIENMGKRLGVPYVSERWIGGVLTNFKIISTRIRYWENLEHENETGGLEKYAKKERLVKLQELAKLESVFGGIKNLKALPVAMVVVDSEEESIAVAEARKKNIPVVALLNTDCDPRRVQYPIPMNDNSFLAIQLVLERLAQAYEKGKKQHKPEPQPQHDNIK